MDNSAVTKTRGSATVDRAWALRNLGFDPGETPPAALFASGAVPKTDEDFQREIIDFDSEAAHGQAFAALSGSTGLSRFTDIPWPKGLAPQPGKRPTAPADSPLPKADVLVVTWTVDEGHALSRVLTPGFDSHNDWVPYAHNFASISAQMRAGSPALLAHNLGTYWTTKIGDKSVVLFKSNSHMSQDGPKLPNRLVWKQLIDEVKPAVVLTTGTGGGIGKEFEVGDVILSSYLRFDCTSKFKAEPFAKAEYHSTGSVAKTTLDRATQLFSANAKQLPPDNTRAPKIVVSNAFDHGVATTDFFGFDNSDDTFHLQGLSDLSEMGDAVLGLVVKEMGAGAPHWYAVRNVSDPQIESGTMTIEQQATFAAGIYKKFGRWSSVCSAITCWSIIAAS